MRRLLLPSATMHTRVGHLMIPASVCMGPLHIHSISLAGVGQRGRQFTPASQQSCSLGSVLLLPVGKRRTSSSKYAGVCHSVAPDIVAAGIVQAGAGTFSSTLTAAIKLGFLCWLVAQMRRIGKLPPNTAPVLSQVTFNLAIPCLLFTKLTQSLSLDNPSLLAIPVMAALQIGAGMLLSKCVIWMVEGNYPRALSLFGWHPRNPSPASAAIAQTAARALGNPAAAAALLPKARQEGASSLAGLITLMCSFGNSFSLPLVFLLTLLPASLTGSATAYTALFLMAWSPLFWYTCSQTFPQPSGAKEAAGDAKLAVSSSSDAPSSSSSSGGGSTLTLMDTSYSRVYRLPGPGGALAESLPPPPPDNSLLAPGPGGMLWGALWAQAQRLWGMVAPYMNPPTLATLAALVVVLVPGAADLFRRSPTTLMSDLAADGVPLEVVALAGGLRACFDMLDVLGGATLALSGIVLAASLLPPPAAQPASSGSNSRGGGAAGPRAYNSSDADSSSSAERDRPGLARDLGSATMLGAGGAPVERPLEVVDSPGSSSSSSRSPSSPTDPPLPPPSSSASPSPAAHDPPSFLQRLQRFPLPLLQLLLPADRQQALAMVLVGVVRLVLMPMVGLGLWLAGDRLGLVPADPICALAVLLQSMMPPAQNLVVYLQLNESTQKLATVSAQMFVRLYLLSVVPITFWVTRTLLLYPITF